MTIRTMTMEDYDNVYSMWQTIKGFAMRSVDDSKEGVTRFIKRNPDTSVVAEADGMIIGSILCGHDGRRGCFYHVCVRDGYRQLGIGKAMVLTAIEALKAEQINKISLIAFSKNEAGNAFWQSLGWVFREDVNYYDLSLNESNLTIIQ